MGTYFVSILSIMAVVLCPLSNPAPYPVTRFVIVDRVTLQLYLLVKLFAREAFACG